MRCRYSVSWWIAHGLRIRSHALQWRHKECDGVSNHRHLESLLKRLFRRRSKKISKLRIIGLREGNPTVTGGFPSQKASNAKKFRFDDVIVDRRCNDFVPNHSELMRKCGSQGVKLIILRYLAMKVYMNANNVNLQHLNEMFTLQSCTYDLRDNSVLERPAARLTNYGLKSFNSYGAKIWNLLPAAYKIWVSFDTFKNMIKTWSGPTCKCSVCCLFTTWLTIRSYSYFITLQLTIACLC